MILGRNAHILYAGFEQGVRVSFDRGGSWTDLRLNMPPVAVPDLRVQPRANDLVLATHGRGFYILDDLAPLQGFSAARGRGAPTLFASRPAYRFAAGYDYGVQADACCVAPNETVGKNPPPGALISYFLPHTPAVRPVVEVIDGGGHVVRRMLGTNAGGINRIAWNLTEDAPLPWLERAPGIGDRRADRRSFRAASRSCCWPAPRHHNGRSSPCYPIRARIGRSRR